MKRKIKKAGQKRAKRQTKKKVNKTYRYDLILVSVAVALVMLMLGLSACQKEAADNTPTGISMPSTPPSQIGGEAPIGQAIGAGEDTAFDKSMYDDIDWFARPYFGTDSKSVPIIERVVKLQEEETAPKTVVFGLGRSDKYTMDIAGFNAKCSLQKIEKNRLLLCFGVIEYKRLRRIFHIFFIAFEKLLNQRQR